MLDPIDLNVEDDPWELKKSISQKINALVCINLLHVAPAKCAEALFKGAQSLLAKDLKLILYGPLFRADKEISTSNKIFETNLKKLNSNWGLRYLEDINLIGLKNKFMKVRLIYMPANNICIIYSKS